MNSNAGRSGVTMGLFALLATAAAGSPPPAGAQGAPQGDGSSGAKSSVGVVKTPNPDDPVEQAYRETQKKRVELDRELKKIRATYFRGIRNIEIRQVGISKLAAYTDPSIYPTLLELFRHEERDVRLAVLDMLIERKSDEADTAITWAAIFDGDRWFREEATKRLLDRTKTTGISNRVKSVIAIGLREKRTEPVVAAAKMASVLGLLEAIPMMISAQVSGGGAAVGGGGADDGGDSALAYILVGQQIAFVSDLTPVVGNSAVAFDPTLSVATDGVVLRVIDAYVITYLVDVHNALVALSTEGWGGQSTASLGWDEQKWRAWYTDEFVPYRSKIEAERAAAAKKAGN